MSWQSDRRVKRLDYHTKVLQNPYYERETKNTTPRRRFTLPKIRLKIFLFSASSLLVFCGIVWLFIFSTVFKLTEITVNVPAKFSASDVQNMARSQSALSRWLLPQTNLFVFDVDQLRQSINSQFAASSLSIKKNFPHKLAISFDEKVYRAIWQEGNSYYLVNQEDDGAVPIIPADLKEKKFPLIVNGGQPGFLNGQIVGVKEKTKAATYLFFNISTNTKYQVEKIEVPAGAGDIIAIKILNGPKILFTTRADLDKQLNKLYTIINERLKADFSKKTYIDIRFNDTVYIK
jgi:cell division septal protein FtsQ